MKLEGPWASDMAISSAAPGHFKGWPLAAALVLSAIFWLLACYGDTAHAMVAIWQRSDTFAHGFVVVPISAWLVWSQRHAVGALEPRPNFYILGLLALAGFGWLLGRVAWAGVVQQYALAVMLPLLVWGILGTRVARVLAFPLFFLLFAVPAGESLEGPLMEHTADFTVAALRLTGIPVYREGQFFTLPTGSWSVVEACSGLRYLIASVTLGFLYAYLMYRTLWRRVAFIVLSIIVPIVANWLRAYMIVMIGHLSDMRYAVGIDHLIYGWVFFGVVMLILFWIGSFWREDRVPPAVTAVSMAPAQEISSFRATIAATLAASLIVAIWPVAASRLEDAPTGGPVALQAPPQVAGWQPVDGGLPEWAPRLLNTQSRLRQVYEKDGRHAAVFIGYYRQQRPTTQLVSSQNVLVSSSDEMWRNVGEKRRTVDLGGRQLAAVEASLSSARAERLLVWRWYWVDGQFVVNPYWAKLLQAKSKLLGRGDDGAFVVVYASFTDRPTAAKELLRAFIRAMLPAITTSLEHASRNGP